MAAQQKLERLRQLLASTPLDVSAAGEKVRVTISAGLASYPQDGEDAAELLALADARMFQAKGEGRNRTVHGKKPVLLVNTPMQDREQIK
jgi:diguanylate cyclase (GGDEF)-like protein